MCGSRKFSLELISRDDLACLTHEAADISGIPFVTDVDLGASPFHARGWGMPFFRTLPGVYCR